MIESSKKGIRIILVMNRKGGAGKSTLCRALASAASAHGETVTIFDTDASRSCLDWMAAGKAAGHWSNLVEVIHTLDAGRITGTIEEIYAQPDQEHLILLDTFGGAAAAQDVLAISAHLIVCPMMLSRADLSEARQTATWYLGLRERVERPDRLANFIVMLSRVPQRVSESEKLVAEELFRSLPALENFLGNRSIYVRMDQTGLLAPMAAAQRNPGVAAHVQSALQEADAVLSEIDGLLAARKGS